MIKAVIFDVGGVLLTYKTKGGRNPMPKLLGMPAKRYNSAKEPILHRWFQGKISNAEVFRILGKEFGISPEKLARTELSAYKKYKTLDKPVFKLALSLKRAGYRIALLTNVTANYKAVNVSTLYKRFSPVVCSCDVGFRKPQRAIYKILLKRLRLPARQVIFFDDHKGHVEGAKKVGMHAAVFKNLKQMKVVLKSHGVKI